MIGSRVCPRCGAREEDGAKFSSRERERQCRECINKREKEYRLAHPEIFKAIDKRRSQKPERRFKYNALTPEEKDKKRISLSERYKKSKADGKCTACRELAVPGKSMCSKHLQQATAIALKTAANRIENESCIACGGKPLATKTLCQTCRRKRNQKGIEKHKKDIAIVLEQYGGKCACCGESEPIFLTIDHKDGDGARHRKETGRNTYYVLIREYKKTGIWPDNFQILCYNCNVSRWRNKGECAHKTRQGVQDAA